MTKVHDVERFRAHVAALQSALDGGDATGFCRAFDALGAEEAYESLSHREAGCGVCVRHKGSFHYEADQRFSCWIAGGEG